MTAGENFTPREVIRLMVDLLFMQDDEALRTPGIARVYLRLAQQFDPNARPALPEKPCEGCGEPL